WSSLERASCSEGRKNEIQEKRSHLEAGGLLFAADGQPMFSGWPFLSSISATKAVQSHWRSQVF
ncbi:hypothetical protein ACEQ6C_38790, partial [Rhizobium ruizarguesonis]